jgi:hypothetical protein
MKSKKKDPFDAQAFLGSPSVAKRVHEFKKRRSSIVKRMSLRA